MNVPPEDYSRQKLEELAVRLESLSVELTALRAELAALKSADGGNQEAGEEVFRAEVIRTDLQKQSNDPNVAELQSVPLSAAAQEAQLRTGKNHLSATDRGKKVPSDLERMIGGRWLTWIGGTTMLVAVAFFIPWACQYFQTPEWFKVLALHA